MNRSWIMRGAPGRWMLALGFFTVASVVLIIPLIVGVLWSLVDPDAGWFPPAIVPPSLSLANWRAMLGAGDRAGVRDELPDRADRDRALRGARAANRLRAGTPAAARPADHRAARAGADHPAGHRAGDRAGLDVHPPRTVAHRGRGRPGT